MLSEHHCRVLRTATDLFMRDFDATQAAIYMEVHDVFTADEAQKVENPPASAERLRQFLRIFTRKAHNLDRLCAYFDQAKQPHLKTFIEDALENHHDNPRQLAGITLSPEHRKGLLLHGMVPSANNLVKRPKLSSEIADKLRKKDQNDSFFLVLHGMAGSGKTSLAAWVLGETDLLGTSFDHVYFVTDSRKDASHVKNLYSDLLVMLSDSHVLINKIDLATIPIRQKISEALRDHPNTLVVLDDVTQAETVLWAENLRLRVLATTRNKSLFNAATADVDFVEVAGFEFEETKEFMLQKGIQATNGNIKAMRAVEMAHNATSGNPAALSKMAIIAAKRPEMLQSLASKLLRSGVSSINSISPYRYNSLHEAFSESVQSMGEREQSALACAAVMPSDLWVPLEVWAMVVPVDVIDAGDIFEEIRVQLRAVHYNGAWLEESEDGEAFRVPSIVSIYLRETVPIESLRECFARLETGISNALSFMAAGDGFPKSPLLRDYFSAHAALFGLNLPGSSV